MLVISHSPSGDSRARQLLSPRTDVTFVLAGGGSRGLKRALCGLLQHRTPVVYLVDIGVSTAVSAVTARLMRRTVVLDTGDLAYALAASVGGRSRASLISVRIGERLALAAASRVVVRGSIHRDHLPIWKDVRVIPDVAPPLASPTTGLPIRLSLGLENKFVVGLVGNIVYAPNLGFAYGWDLIEAVAILPPRVSGLIVGDGDGLAWLKGRARDFGVTDRIHFVGRVTPAKVQNYIAAMDVAISTQTNDDVGAVRTTGKVPLYLACGCPVIATHVGEAARILGPEGWTLPYEGTVDATYPGRLADAVRALALDPDGSADRRSVALRLSAKHYRVAEMQGRLARALAG